MDSSLTLQTIGNYEWASVDLLTTGTWTGWMYFIFGQLEGNPGTS